MVNCCWELILVMQSEDQQNASGQQGQEQKDDGLKKAPYTMHGVLHYLQHEWSRSEMERAKWEMERAEMQARISFLQGERKGQENLKADLIRRIKMLEYCLKQERAKNYRLTHNGEDPPQYEEVEPEIEPVPENPISTDDMGPSGSALTWKQGRQLLKQYLQEIGYSENILDVRSFRVKNLLGLIPEGDWPSSERVSCGKYNGAGKRDDDSDCEGEERGKEFDADAARALDEFSFLKEEKTRDEWSTTNHDAIDRLKEQYKSEKRTKRNTGSTDEEDDRKPGGDELINIPANAPKGKSRRDGFMDLDDALGLSPDEAIDIKDNFIPSDYENSPAAMKWSLKTTLRSHLDSIRAMQFHPVEPVLFTASEDSTIKMWCLESTRKDEKHEGLEPIYTFRGHLGPVLCLDLSPTGDCLYTGGHDGKICCWNVPSSNTDPHEAYDPNVLSEKLKGHQDVVWAIAYHSSDNKLASASSDGTIKLWEPGNFDEPLLRTIEIDVADAVPTSVDFVSTEQTQLLAGYTKAQARIIDIETGSVLLSFDFGEEAMGLITRILSHPTMAMTVIAGDDRKIRYFDNTTGKQIHSTVAHMDGISSLAIDPNGLYLLSGSHDGSLRLWNMEKKICLQEISAHRKKFDSSVNCVAFHPSRPLIGSAGADALAKVFSVGLDPSISASHLISNGRIADTLAEAGHEVVMFVPEYIKSLASFKGAKKAKIIHMKDISTRFDDDLEGLDEYMFTSDRLSFLERLYFENTCSHMCNAMMERKEELQPLIDYKFDVAFAEQIDLCGIGVLRYLGIENILWISTTPIMDAVSYNLGIPAPTSYVPTIEENDNGDSMNFWDRLFNLYMYVGTLFVHRWGTDTTTEVFRRHVRPDFPNVREIAGNSSLCFVNADEMFDLPRPIIHKTIYVGGLGVKEPKPLEDEKFKQIMEKGEKGVIIMSFGSIVQFHALPPTVKDDLVKVVRQKKEYHFLFRVSKDDTTTRPLFQELSNVDFTEWLPQSDILAHPRLQLFIMHGGLNGLTEAMLRGVPVVVIPIFADQFRNGRNVEKRYVGKVVLKKDLNEKNILNAINTILGDENYRKSAKRMQKLMKNKPFTAAERLVRWTEFAAEHGVLEELHVRGAQLSTIEYFNLDVLLFLITIAIVVLYVLICIIRLLLRSTKKQKKE
ncbi:unnamed protein product [Auanema sp. JU1783]|nr:unnamed protein product [Auanema sp. JU1783]